ncbi:MAG: aldehyde ferredoxin oxidoreductase C-terminal domain-containing protein [Bacillota bacterium]|nr:aldehyde ferredoxin oxidoreductase C-terminal domain-containing protein [Bacillota bacterium]
MVGGFNGRILTVDLTTKQTEVRSFGEAEVRKYLGGRGLAAYYYVKEVPASCDPLGSENSLIIMTGPLTGTSVPASTKLSLATKSPETGHYTTSNAGGDFGPFLKQAGFDGLIIRGASAEPTWISLEDGQVEFHEAASLWGKDAFSTAEALAKERPGASVVCIGPAGEVGVRFATVQADGRSFGRGGAGAVFGAKKLKAITVSGHGSVPVADPQGLKAVLPQLSQDVRAGKLDLTEYGTNQLTEIINSHGCYPTRNFSTATFEGAGELGARTMKARYWVKNEACWRCPIACTKRCQVNQGPWAGAQSDPDYESIWALGGHCGVADFGAVVKANWLCDAYGMDTMSGGYMVGLAMELFERGLITLDDTDGIAFSFGNATALVEGLRLIAERKAIGNLLAEGVLGVAKAHPEWSKYLMHVKGSPLAAYDPRGLLGMGLAYGTSSRGACHNVGGWTISEELLSGKYDPLSGEGKAHLVRTAQDTRAYVDSLGLCTNARKPLGFTESPREVVLKLVTGLDLTSDLMTIGERIYSLERLCLNREGITTKDDQLPERLTSEVLPAGPAQGRRVEPEIYRKMLQEYYQERGWDEQGIVRGETLRRLGLSELVADGAGRTAAITVSNIERTEAEPGPKSFSALLQGEETKVLRDSFILLSPANAPTDNLTAGYTVIYPGCRTSGHAHAEYEEIYHVTKGAGRMRIGEEEFEIKAGDTFLVPFGLFHTTFNPHHEVLEYFWVLSGCHGHPKTDRG